MNYNIKLAAFFLSRNESRGYTQPHVFAVTQPASLTISLSSGVSSVSIDDEVEEKYGLDADVGSLEHAERPTTADPPNLKLGIQDMYRDN